jgi:integrase
MFKRKDGRWFFRTWVRLPDGTKRRVFGTPRELGLPNTKAACKEAEQQKIRRVLDGIVDAPPPVRVKASTAKTLNRFESTFLEHSAGVNESSSLDSKKQILRTHIKPILGETPLDLISYAAIEDFKHAMLAKGLKAKTVNNILTVLRRLLVVAKKRGEIVSVPEIEWLPVPANEFDFFTFDEAPRLRDAAAGDGEWRAMIMLGLLAGLRQSELLGLHWDDLDLVAGRIVVRRARVRGKMKGPKNGKPREIPMSDALRVALKGHRHLRGDFVFCDLDGQPLTKGACKHPLWRACKRAGLRRIGWHVLRHTFASHLAMRGVPLKVIQELMGHSTIQITMRYAHLAPKIAREAVKLLDLDAPVTGDSAVTRSRPDRAGGTGS